MGSMHGDAGDAVEQQVAEDARAIAMLAAAASDYECVGAEAAAEFGW